MNRRGLAVAAIAVVASRPIARFDARRHERGVRHLESRPWWSWSREAESMGDLVRYAAKLARGRQTKRGKRWR